MPDNALNSWIEGLPLPPLLAQLIIVLLALGLGFGFGWLLRRWFAGTRMATRRMWSARLAEFVLIVTPALFAAALVGWLQYVEEKLDAIDLAPGDLEFSVWTLIKSLVVVTLFLVGASLVSRTVETRVMKLEGLAPSTRIGISKFTNFFLLGLGILLGIDAAGIPLTTLTVLTGAMGLGLGFGLQAIAANFVSGFVLLMDKSIKTENFGWVEELRGRYVVVRDRDGVATLVPNQNVITNPVINWSYSDPKVRLKLPVRISYSDDPEVALQVLAGAAFANPRVLSEPRPVSRLMHFGESGIELELRFWISDPQEGVNNVRSDVNRAIWRAFKEHGITIPVQQHDLRMVTVRGGGP
jgi:small-conductance mechanosensitive channel